MDISSVEELKVHKGRCVVVDVRGSDEAIRLGNAIEGSINIPYESDEGFVTAAVGKLPEDKTQAIICH